MVLLAAAAAAIHILNIRNGYNAWYTFQLPFSFPFYLLQWYALYVTLIFTKTIRIFLYFGSFASHSPIQCVRIRRLDFLFPAIQMRQRKNLFRFVACCCSSFDKNLHILFPYHINLMWFYRFEEIKFPFVIFQHMNTMQLVFFLILSIVFVLVVLYIFQHLYREKNARKFCRRVDRQTERQHTHLVTYV